MIKLVPALFLATALSAWAGSDIGSVSENKGTACEIVRGKSKLGGAKGASIESMDTYVTGACASSITFKDDTKVKVTENSRLIIDDFVYDPKQSDAGKLAMKVGMGTVRYASGQIAKTNPQQVAIKTPTANIAVRGTDFTMTVDEAGQSLVVLLPSCKEHEKIKEYELEENTCRVGKIEVETQGGKVVLDQAFHATYISSNTQSPTPPTLVNITEGKIGNNLIIVKPAEVANAIKEHAKTKHDRELEDIESEAQRRISIRIKETNDEIEQARLLALAASANASGCNPSTSVCVIWQQPDAVDSQGKGKGIAFRSNEDHYAEVKTQGYSSNTTITIVHNDTPATEVIGSGDFGGNSVYIKQNTGATKRK